MHHRPLGLEHPDPRSAQAMERVEGNRVLRREPMDGSAGEYTGHRRDR